MSFVVFAGQSNTGGAFMGPQTLTKPWTPDPLTEVWNAQTRAWETMQPGLNTGYGGQPAAWAGEVRFALDFRTEHPGELLRIVKIADGGTGLAKDDGAWVSDWSPASHGELFDKAATQIADARAAAGGVKVDAVFWGQGEEDAATWAKAHAYAQNLPDLFTAIRARWMGNDQGHLGFFRINSSPAFAGEVRAAELATDQADANAVSFDADPFARQGDGLHFSAAGYDAIGDADYRIFQGWSSPAPVSGGGGGGGLPADAMKWVALNILRVADGTGFSTVSDVIHAAGASTSVAALSYQFFTGHIPTAAGIDYLVSPTGPNPANLHSAYYQAFNLENRYINFAVNLGVAGEGHAAFQAAYGGMNLFDAARAAYGRIFGDAPSDAKLHAVLDQVASVGGAAMTRADYFAAYGQDGHDGLGTKAAMVGWLLAEAVKADVGVYAKAEDAFLADLADGAVFGVDLIGTYGHPQDVYHPG